MLTGAYAVARLSTHGCPNTRAEVLTNDGSTSLVKHYGICHVVALELCPSATMAPWITLRRMRLGTVCGLIRDCAYH